MNKSVYRSYKHHIDEFCSQIHKLNCSNSKINLTKFKEPQEIEFQSYGNRHISWNSGFSICCRVINEALQILETDKNSEKMNETSEIKNDADIDVLDVDIPNNEYSMSGDEEQSLNDLLCNEIIRYDEIGNLYKRVEKTKLSHIPDTFFKFNCHYISSFLTNYELKSDFIFKIWVNYIKFQDSIIRFLFCDLFITADKLKPDFGDIRFILCGEINEVKLKAIEFWSRKSEGLPESLLFTSILDPHRTLASEVMTIINVGQYRRCSHHVTYSEQKLQVGMPVEVSVIRTGRKSLCRFDMTESKTGIYAKSEFFTCRKTFT